MPGSKQDKPLGERLKAWFRSSKSNFTRPQDVELELRSETVRELGSDQPLHVRLQTLKELQDLVRDRRLKQHGVELIWVKICDLLEPKSKKEVRHSVLEFLQHLIIGQYTTLEMMRAEFFRFLKRHTQEEDLCHRIKLLNALTEEGKDILHFEDEMGVMLLDLLRASTEKQTDCLEILGLTVNLVKFNSAYLEPEIVSNLIGLLFWYSRTTDRNGEIKKCLEIYKCIVMYNFVPSEALLHFVSCLCSVVNLPEVCQDAWNTMRSLIGTQLGHSALFNLCVLIQSTPGMVDVALIRGAIFFIGSSLWGPNLVPSLKYSAMTVLPVFLIALKECHQLVVYEMALQMESLVIRQGRLLNAPGWEEAVTVLETLVNKLERCDSDVRPQAQHHLQLTIVNLEALAMNKQYPGSQSRVYDLVESVSDLVPEQSVLHLLAYRLEHIYPANEGWIEKLSGLMDRFYDCDVRQGVRVRMLSILKDIVTTNILMYEDKLLEVVVLPFLANLDSEIDRVVKIQGIQTISALAAKASKSHQKDLLDILEKILRKIEEPVSSQDTAVLYTRQDFQHYLEAVVGLINIFKEKFYRPPVSCVRRCYDILVTVLDKLYKNHAVMEHTGDVRLEIFRCFLSLRARHDYHMGFVRDCGGEGGCVVVFSPYVLCESRQPGQASNTNTDKGMVTLSLTRACRSVIRCLNHERDWTVLSLVLEEVPRVLQNKGMLVRYEESISWLAGALCALVQTGSAVQTRLPDIRVPQRFGRTDLNMAVYPVLAALASYNRWLDLDIQKRLIKSLEYGLRSRDCNKVCTVALTACILEMSSSMNTFLPEVLLNLSKISATVHIAIPVLEFLSTLISLPKVFASFNKDQYMSVFAITLPYTNPFKFNHYTVSLAHHVIIMWFLKCRLSSRKDFVSFIVKGLEGNVLQPFEEGNFRKNELAAMNQDSSNRARSTSLVEESRPTRTRHMTGVTSRPPSKHKSGPDERQALHTFHQELTETSLDIMSRYSFANPSVKPERSSLTQFLLQSGNSASWLLGSAIMTISVSGCGNLSSGTCEACRQHMGYSAPQTESVEGAKRRHVSEQSVRTTPQPSLAPLSQDDMGLRTSGGEPGLRVEERKNSLEGQRKEKRLCSCWCQGWCEVLIRRPSGEVSWMCKLQNGQLTQGMDDQTLSDITAMLVAESEANQDADKTARPKVARSNSNPEIVEKLSELELNKGRTNNRKSCDPIPEEEATGKPVPFNRLSEPRRPRSNTIDSTSPVKNGPQRSEAGSSISLPSVKQERSNVISPKFMFLQLYQAAGLPAAWTEKPLPIPNTKPFENTLKILDMIPCQETHKIGVLYVGPGQSNSERDILANRYGSARYAAFLQGLGSLVDLSEVNTNKIFLGGLSYKDGDGEFAYVWQDDAMQVVYHTATLMPNRESDPQFNKKKRHIGNNYVAIVYNEAGQPYEMGIVKGQFIYVTVVVEPMDFQSNKISVLAKPELSEYLSHLFCEKERSDISLKVVSDDNLSMLVRQIALHCNLAANIYSNLQKKLDPYASNWLERLRHIKRLKAKLLKERENETEGGHHDFTGFRLNKSS